MKLRPRLLLRALPCLAGVAWFLGIASAPAQTDALIKARPDFQNQIYLAAPTNALGTALAQPASVVLASGSLGDATNLTNRAPGDGLVFLAQSLVGQPFAALPVALAPPVIDPGTTNILTATGGNFTLAVSASGEPAITYQWFLNNVALTGVTNATFALTNVQLAQTGNYTVVVSNVLGSATSLVATVTIPTLQIARQGSGTVSTNPAQLTYAPGQQVTLTATPARYYAFLRWSDGVTASNRTITIGATNVFTAIFTNTVPLEELVIKQWDKSFGGTGDDLLYGLQQTADGGFILGGWSSSGATGSKTSTNFGAQDFWVLRLDADGNKLWERSFGGAGDDGITSLQQTSDGGFILGGCSRSGVSGNKTNSNFGGYDFWVVRLDTNGDKVLERIFGGTGDDILYGMQQTTDGGFILGGYSISDASGNKTSPNFGAYDFWVVRLDASGNKLWDRSFGGSSYDAIASLQQTADGGFILGGFTQSGADGNKTSASLGSRDFWAVRLDTNGNPLWDRSFGGSGFDDLTSLQQTFDGGFILSGYSQSSPSGNKTSPNFGSYDFWVVRLDSTGNELWDRSFGGTGQDVPVSIRQTSAGGFIVGGSATSGTGGSKTSFGQGGYDCWVVRLDANGNQLWDPSFGGTGDDSLSNLERTMDGGYILGGYSLSGLGGDKTSPSFGNNDFWIVKLSSIERPIGTPVVLVNGLYGISNTFTFTETNVAQVSLSTTFSNGTIRYTLDGSAPTLGSPLYTGAFNLTNAASVTRAFTITAVAWNSNLTASATNDAVTVTFVPRVLNLAQQGRGTVTATPAQTGYALGQTVTLTATPGRYYQFLRWSDGNTNATRPITIGVSNNLFTALFTNTVPLEELVFPQWEKVFGGTDEDRCNVMRRTADGGFLLAGSSRSTLSGNKTSEAAGTQGMDCWVIKTDSAGNKEWDQEFGGAGYEYVTDIILTGDGGYLLVCATSSEGGTGNKSSALYGVEDFWLIKLDAEGHKLFEREFGGTGGDAPGSGALTADGGFILTGVSDSPAVPFPTSTKTALIRGQRDMWLLKLNAEANFVQDWTYGSSENDSASGVVATRDGGYFLAGGFSLSQQNRQLWTVKVDRNGVKEWEPTFGDGANASFPNTAYAARQTYDNGFVVLGVTPDTTGNGKTAPRYGDFDWWLLRLDASGGKLWDKSYGGSGSDYLSGSTTGLQITHDGSFILTGSSTSAFSGNKQTTNHGSFDGWVVRTDSSGNKKWEMNFGGTGEDAFSATEVLPDGYLLAGYTASANGSGTRTTPGHGGQDFWLVKLTAREAPIGTPVVLVNGLYNSSNFFAIPATNQVSVTLTSTFPDGYIYYTLDGSVPVPGDNAIEYSAPGIPGTPFAVTNSVVVTAVAYSSDATENVEADADPVAIHIVPLYNLTNTTPGGGSVAMNPPGGIYLSNTVVTLTATPASGWTFLRWNGAVTATGNPLALTMDGAKSIRAVFGTGLTTTTNLAGTSVTLWPAAGPYPYGSLVRLVGVPGAGNRFNRWFSNISGPTTNTLDFTVLTANTNVAAFFVTLTGNNFTLTTLLNGYGTVNRNPAANSYASNASVTLTAQPDAGYAFTGWSGDTNSALNPLTLVMNANKTMTASFTVPPTVAITAPTNGAVLDVPDFAFNAIVTDADGSVTKVDFYLNGTLAATITNAPFNLIVSNVASGLYSLTAKATDNTGGAGTSAPVSITVSLPPPVITAFSPQSGPIGSSITVSGANFSRHPSSNAVYFGAVRAVVTAAETNSLTVTVPIAAAYAPISVTRGGLTGWATRAFAATFSSSRVIDSSSFRYDGVGSFTSIAPNPNRVAIGDLDGDGKVDLAMGNGAFISIAHNLGSPGGVSYEQQTRLGTNTVPYNFNSVAFADMDGDGKLDVVAGGLDGFVTVYRNISTNGNLSAGSFASPVRLGTGGNFVGLAIADLDLDGRPDIVVGDYYRNNIIVFRNVSTSGTVAFASQVACSIPVSNSLGGVALCDFNGDGKQELVMWESSSSVVSIFENTSPTGAIQPGMWNSTSRVDFAVADGPSSVVIGDLDGDGKPDLAVSGYRTNRVSVLRNTCVGGVIDNGCFSPRVDFVRPSSAGYATQIAIADLNGDGKPELVTVAGRAVTSIYRNTSSPGIINSGSFAARVDINLAGDGVAVGDFDGDGKPDLVTADEAYGVLYFYVNQLGPENVSPTVMMTSPTNDATFTTPASIPFTASASDADGTVTQVLFYAGATLLGRVTNAPFNFTWTNAVVGGHSLTALATDNGGLSATSAPVSITVNAAANQPPLVSLVSPTNGATFGAGTNVTLTANALDGDGSVTRVEFYSGGTNLIGISSNGVANQFSVVWSNVVPGSYALTARAFDNLGASNVSAAGVTVLLFDGPPAFRFEQSGYSVGEGDGTVTLRVIRNFRGFAVVNYSTADGSANAGADYNAVAGQLQFQSGESVKNIPVTILEDLVVEGSHTFMVTLSTNGIAMPNGLANPSVATVTILDNDVQTPGSFLSVKPVTPVNPNDLGSLRVYLTGVSNGVGQWRLPWERTFRNSGEVATGLQPGNYAIEFKPLAGHVTPPPPATLAVAAGQESRSTNSYTFLISTPTGSLTVFIDPASVATNSDPGCRGQWTIPGHPFMDSGAMVTGLPAGGYTMTFRGLDAGCGWSTPLPRDVTVYPGVSNSFRASYVTNVAGPSTPGALNFASDLLPVFDNALPQTYCGQIVTEFGSGSGVVVKERVVLTAAHVVFDDFSLAWVGNAQWFFQRHAPEYNPAPQEVRGYFVNGGYAAQRNNESPGVSSPASFDLDVAALYFYQAAGRGGYGGYLASDSPTPLWLLTNTFPPLTQRALVGYPVEGIAPANLGKMHRIGPTSMSFEQSTGAVFTCATIRGLPGNSGGPLCVQWSDGRYFPAAIYVGGSDKAIVRAIDSRAVELINLAELTSNLGTNQTGGGPVIFTITVPVGTCYQSAYVTLAPPAALSAGAQWRVHYKPATSLPGSLSAWTGSSNSPILLNNKPDYLELAPAEGFQTPSTADYTLGCVGTNLVFTYVQLLPRLGPLEADTRHLVLLGVTNRTYRVEYNGRLGVTNGWLPLTNITFPANNGAAILSNALHNLPTNRFYCAVRVP